jgi:hypothetical protein
MTLFKKGLLAIAASFMLASCSTLTSLTSSIGGANNEAVDGANVAQAIKTKDLYGAWAVTDKGEVDFLYLVVLMPNHIGMNYLTIDEKNGKPESEYTEFYRWEFNEKDNIFTSHAYKRETSEYGQPAKIEEVNETDHYDTMMYMKGSEVIAVRFTKPDENYVFVKMDDETYQTLVKDVPGLQKIK